MLAPRLDGPVEVLNAGTPRYSSHQGRVLARRLLGRFDVDDATRPTPAGHARIAVALADVLAPALLAARAPDASSAQAPTPSGG